VIDQIEIDERNTQKEKQIVKNKRNKKNNQSKLIKNRTLCFTGTQSMTESSKELKFKTETNKCSFSTLDQVTFLI
jgi:hypothetical protein